MGRIAGIGVLLRGLTWAGVAHAWALGAAVYSAFGWGAYVMVCAYFVLGSAATNVKMKEKELRGIAEKRSGRRGPGSVWGSGLGAKRADRGRLAVRRVVILRPSVGTNISHPHRIAIESSDARPQCLYSFFSPMCSSFL